MINSQGGGIKFLLFFISLPIYFPAYCQTHHFSKDDLNSHSKSNLEKKFFILEVPTYTKDTSSQTIFLENGYSLSTIKNKDSWPKRNLQYEVTEIRLIYTKYPREKELWLTDYRKLMVDRLNELFKLDSSLNSDEIDWSIVLQTECRTEPQAKALLHGFEIVYEELEEEMVAIKDSITTSGLPKETQDSIYKAKKNENQIRSFLKQLNAGKDSTIEKILERHPEWKNSLVVMDWTGSMQEFGSKVILWYAMNMQRCGIRYIVLFTDGTFNKGRMGNYGGIYFAEVKKIKKVIQLMKHARNQDMNREIEENNVEAILKGIQRFPKFDELILIADNRSCMKDFCLAWKINVPVKIVLCGTTGGINPQYITLAYMTKGSIHTIDSDIYDINPIKLNGDTIKIDNSAFAFDPKKKRFYTIGGGTGYQNCRRFYGKCK